MTQPVDDQPINESHHEFVPHCTTPGLCNFEEGHFACMQPRSALIHQVTARPDQPTSSKQGKWVTCSACKGTGTGQGDNTYCGRCGGDGTIEISERGAGDEGRKCVECGHSGNIIGGLCQAVIDRQDKSESCLCRCTFAPREAERHERKKSTCRPPAPGKRLEIAESEVNQWMNLESVALRISPGIAERLVDRFAVALTAATDEVWERAIAAFNNEIARQAEFGMYPSEEDFRLAFDAARKE